MSLVWFAPEIISNFGLFDLIISSQTFQIPFLFLTFSHKINNILCVSLYWANHLDVYFDVWVIIDCVATLWQKYGKSDSILQYWKCNWVQTLQTQISSAWPVRAGLERTSIGALNVCGQVSALVLAQVVTTYEPTSTLLVREMNTETQYWV